MVKFMKWTNETRTTRRKSLLKLEAQKLLHHLLREITRLQPTVQNLQDIYNYIDEVYVTCVLEDSEGLSFEEVLQVKTDQIS